MSPEIIEQFAKYGGYIGLLMGVMIASMCTAIVFLWRHKLRLQDQLIEVQNKRVEEAKEVRAELLAVSKDTSKVTFELTAALSAMRDAVILRER
jgi:uncharacterized membrane protein